MVVENWPKSQRSVDNAKNAALRSALSRSAVAGRKRCPAPRSSLLDALTGFLRNWRHFWHDGLALSSCSRETKSPHSVRRRPPTEFPGFGRPFGCGFSALPWNVVSPPSEAPGSRSVAPGRSWGYSTRRCGPVVGAIAGFEGERISTPLAVA